ncbi:hydantoinase/oxoprolinase N-terminal domain-containing protein [Parahaliea aestuarii]|uniref:Hydantoinase/oxoprolinase family protein n=1 Tax=Parahaliea aestuarii TaxID=1852021 RepID=A0A5C8ZVF7_9GAMM|nr:hydantoinase/oxoprolinase family protein [Parahaliea aestuarii]TXS91562.1 hydantoinase/oxoprolinase family protein [Parahaliea aestuarii]
MRIGIDVGGTHTDAVLLNGDDVVSSIKTLTTADVSSGVFNALEHVLSDSQVEAADIEAVMLGTTQFTNAVVERRQLSEVAAIRIGLPSGRGLPPMSGWPADIAGELGGHGYMLHGGTLYDGRPLADLRDSEIDSVVEDIRHKGLDTVAISAAFSPMAAGPELAVAEKLRAAIPGVNITCSHQIGRLGLLERENAALLNAALLKFSERVVRSFGEALVKRGLSCPFYISQNDGTLMDAEFVRQFPALTFASGPTNSLRGACKLTGLDDAIVVDIGGTTSDIGVLQGGFPRESNVVIEVGGVRTNFRMPDILAIGLGGGSLVSADGAQIGPRSVGHKLVSEGLAFGGGTLTATDLLVAAGQLELGGDTRPVSLDPEVTRAGLATITRMLNTGIERMLPSKDRLPVILVGGGAVLVSGELEAAARILRPQHAGVANAIGAAIAQIGGEVERLVSYREEPREAAIKRLSQEACAQAVAAGADPASVRIADIEETTISYMEEGSTRLRLKAVGDIARINTGVAA